MDNARLTYVLDADWGSSTKMVCIAIAEHLDDQGVAWPGLERLATMAGISDRQVMREVVELEKLAVYLVTRHRGTGNRYQWIADVGPSPVTGSHQFSPKPDDGTGESGDTTSPGGRQGVTPSTVLAAPSGDTVSPELSREENNHPQPCAREAGGDGLSKTQRRQHFESALTDLRVAVGPVATLRWISLVTERGATTLADCIECVRFCVRAARADGLIVEYASHVEQIAKRWSPRDLRLGETA